MFPMIAAIGIGAATAATSIFSGLESNSNIESMNSQARSQAASQNMYNDISFMRNSLFYEANKRRMDKEFEFRMDSLERFRQNTFDSMNFDYNQLQKQENQIEEGYSTDVIERIRQNNRERSQIKVSAAEAEVGGNLAETLQNDMMFQTGYDLSLLEQDMNNRVEEVKTARTDTYNRALSRINEIYNTGVNYVYEDSKNQMDSYSQLIGSRKNPVTATITPTRGVGGIIAEGALKGISSGIGTYGGLSKGK